MFTWTMSWTWKSPLQLDIKAKRVVIQYALIRIIHLSTGNVLYTYYTHLNFVISCVLRYRACSSHSSEIFDGIQN